MIEITERPISPDVIINRVKTNDSGCAVTYIGLIRSCSRGKLVNSVEYKDTWAVAEGGLQQIADEINKGISDILNRALAGYKDDYKYKHHSGDVYIRWGKVEQDMHKVVTYNLTADREG